MTQRTQPFLRVAGVEQVAEIAQVAVAGKLPDQHHLVVVVTLDKSVVGRIRFDEFNGETFLRDQVALGKLAWQVGPDRKNARVIACKHDIDCPEEVIVVLRLPEDCPQPQGVTWPQQPPLLQTELQPCGVPQAPVAGFRVVSASVPEIESMTVAGLTPSSDMLVVVVRYKSTVAGSQALKPFDGEAFLRRQYLRGRLFWHVGLHKERVRMIACAVNPSDPRDVYVVLEPPPEQIFFAGVDWNRPQVTFQMIDQQGLPESAREAYWNSRMVVMWLYGRKVVQHQSFKPLYHPQRESGYVHPREDDPTEDPRQGAGTGESPTAPMLILHLPEAGNDDDTLSPVPRTRPDLKIHG